MFQIFFKFIQDYISKRKASSISPASSLTSSDDDSSNHSVSKNPTNTVRERLGHANPSSLNLRSRKIIINPSRKKTKPIFNEEDYVQDALNSDLRSEETKNSKVSNEMKNKATNALGDFEKIEKQTLTNLKSPAFRATFTARLNDANKT